MSSECILCGTNTSYRPSLPQIFDAFRALISILEKQARNSENENTAKIKRLYSQIDEVTKKSRLLEEEKVNAETRSDLYKKRFLDAQKAIEQLHEKNVRLSSQSSNFRIPIDQLRNFPFSSPRQGGDLSPKTKKIILAPDTCAPVAGTLVEDATYISSDEDDFKEDPRAKNKSPRLEKATPKSVTDSLFTKPNSPQHILKKKKVVHHTPVFDNDMDETRLDVEDPMETSIAHSADLMDTSLGLETGDSGKLAEAIGNTSVLELCTDADSIPPSPVLSVGKERRFGSFRRSREGFLKRNDPWEKENKSPRKPSQKFHDPHVLKSSNFLKIEHSGKESDVSHSRQEGNPLNETLPLHRPRETTPAKRHPGNTSLDELFDKTYGDLETTTMLHNTNLDEMKQDVGQDDTDDELDALLLQGVDEAELSYGNDPGPSSFGIKNENLATRDFQTRKPPLEDSFDVLPSKSKNKKNFKYQEVVRKRNEREKLDAKACAQCEEYYSDLPEEERREIMRKVCRHKHVDAPPSTPEHFWEVGIPDTEECRRRGYITDETDLPPEARQGVPRVRRKKPLEPFFNKKR